MSFDHKDHVVTNLAIDQLEQYISEIQQWMLTNKLKLTGNETKFIEISNWPHLLQPSNTTLKVGPDDVLTSPSTKNMGVTLDNEMLGPHVQALCKSADYQLFRISRIQKYLIPEATATLIHSLIMSRRDYCNIIPHLVRNP